jgi:hypothetical protein
MAAKKTRTSKASNQRDQAKAALELSASARDEVARLLKDGQDGTITRLELETGLEEVEERLKRLLVMIRHFL